MIKVLKNNKGLTLLELVVSLMIVSILFLGIFEIFSLSIKTNKSINTGMDYVHFAQGLMEEYRSMAYPVLNNQIQKSTDYPKKFEPDVVIKNGYEGRVTICQSSLYQDDNIEILVRVYPIGQPTKEYKLLYIKTKY